MLRKFFPCAMVLFFVSAHQAVVAREGEPSVKVEISLEKGEIFAGEGVAAVVSVTNAGTRDLTLPRPDRAPFAGLWEFDDPRVQRTGGVGLIRMSGESPTVSVKPGETVKTKLGVYVRSADPGPLLFRAGFRTSSDGAPTWSDGVTLQIKADKPSPLKVEITMKGEEINISNPRSTESLKGHLRISNHGLSPQGIGTDRICGVEELNSLVGDNTLIRVHSAEVSCLENMIPPRDVVLSAGQTYEQDFRVTYAGEDPAPGKVTFRVGVKSVGILPAWSPPATVRVVGGTPAWTARIRYLRNLEKERTMRHPDGIFKAVHEDGTLREETEYKNGRKNGRSKNYRPDGKLFLDEMYSDGKMVSYKSYNADGSIHGHLTFMRLLDGKYVEQDTCAEKDSDKEVLTMMPRCEDLDADGRVVYPYKRSRRDSGGKSK